MAAPDTLIDQVFDGRYRVVRKLGTGGMANVYLAEDQELGRSVAIKMLDERHAQDEQFVERFRREAKNAAGALAPEHRLDLRPRAGRGDLLHRDGVPRGAHPQGAPRHARADAARGRDRLRAADPLRARVRAPARDRPPRHQAAQRRRRPGRPAEGDGLRDRALGDVPDDRDGVDHRDGAVPLARAGEGRAGDAGLGHLLGRDRPVRDDDGSFRSPGTRRSRSR